MDGALLVAAGTVAAGASVSVLGLAMRARSREEELDALLVVPNTGFGVAGGRPAETRRVARRATPDHGTVVAGTLDLAELAIGRWDPAGSLRLRIQRADLSLRPAELVVIAGAFGLAVGLVLAALTGRAWMVAVVLALEPFAVAGALAVLAARRTRRFAEALPDALSLTASSLTAGHTFLRSIQLMTEDREGPLADEFRRVVAETQLGAPLVDSLERMAGRIQLRDLDWMVQAVRIQQTLGGHLGDLLGTLAEFMRARDEVRREIKVLTAEGRASAWVLGAMPVLLFLAVQVINPGYTDPLLRGWGLVVLGLTGLSMSLGVAFILKMVRAVEV